MSTNWIAWGPLLLWPPLVAILFPSHLPRWSYMWCLAVTVFAGCKWLTWCIDHSGRPLRLIDFGYLFGWPSMQPKEFFGPYPGTKPSLEEWIAGLLKLAIGLLLLFIIIPSVPARFPHFRAWSGMVGVVMVLYFGLFHLISCGWRRSGVNARVLMRWPLLSTSVGEFWGKRWNTAFRDLTHRLLFRPLAKRFGSAVSCLFHSTFLNEVMSPFLRFLGAM